jgi:hypothetical protein
VGFRNASNFLFDVKLHGLLSCRAVKAMSLPPDIRRDAETNPRGNLILTPKLERLVAERILAEVEPLREAGKLGAFLLRNWLTEPQREETTFNSNLPFSVDAVLDSSVRCSQGSYIPLPSAQSLRHAGPQIA